ncbi:cytochrome P450 [Lactarius pseudohatsudake]|nr:cytochrome P450 [Lactarius pseudohatsudake]
MTDLTAILFTLSAGFSLVAFLYSRRRSGSLRDIRGPASSSFWLGNEADIRYQNEAGDCEFKWMREYGSAWRRTGCLGTDRLMVADPKASKHILHSAGYRYPKTIDRAQFARLAAGNGLRKIMSPAFATHQIQSFLPLFYRTASKWWGGSHARHSTLLEKVSPFSLAVESHTDRQSKAGFDFQFGSLDDLANPLVLRNDKEFVDSLLYPSWYDLVFKGTWKYIPRPLLEYVRYIPTREYRGWRSWLDNVRVFSRGLIKQSTDKGDGNDIMSILLRANGSSNPKNKMTDDEMVDQIATFLSAGHETTAKALTWYFHAIAKHPEAQVRIREEIALVRARAAGELTIADLDSMAYTLATLKESMRLDPIIWYTARIASRDDILPLAFPITTKSGQQITSIPIQKGTPIDISLAVYNRLPDVWGEDANEWNPERFLDPLRGFKEASSNIGVFGSFYLATGTRGCIGWQFAVLEMQIIILALLENFEISLPPQNEKTKIYRRPSHVMLPMREGQNGTWMGLHIKSLN